MDIVVIRERFNPYGGAELRTADLVRSMLDRGHSVTILARAWPREDPARQPSGNLERASEKLTVINLGSNPFYPSARLKSFRLQASAWLDGPGRDRDAALSLERVPGTDVFRAGDGCHAAWLTERSRYVQAFKRLSFKLNPLHRTHLALERDMLHHPNLNLVVANSRMVKDDLLRHYPDLDPGLIKVVRAGVDYGSILVPDPARAAGEVRRELSVGDSPLILFVGSGFRRKGLAYALRSLPLLRHNKTVLAVAGKDKLKPYLNLARSLGIRDRVRFLGPRTDVARLLCAADAFVLPTIYDPASVACLEALLAGLPVVTTRANGSSEFIEEGFSGFTLDRADHLPALARYLDEALDLGRSPYGRADIPSMDQHTSAILDLIEDSPRPKT